ncbi:putative 50 kda protein in type i retrotransposable element r1dm [Lasius niger]|uniref:Putative 50 kDa protein in type i retrotransposable element r1dm n=1 Tax=Lasius niger TaxID=67767 RepID=A0A0J7KR41_LASNI|nr:putative 50 kda protein in type i retrotransposable element r1dm [Lasius niger]
MALRLAMELRMRSQVGSRDPLRRSCARGAEVRVSGGPTVELTDTTSFIVAPGHKHVTKYDSSQATKDVLCRVLRPSDCGLRVNRVSLTRGNGVKIEAFSPDMDRIKAHPGLAAAGLVVQENIKLNPRLIMHGIPADMSAEEIKTELAAQNLSGEHCNDIKVIYVFPPKKDRHTKGCVLEVAPIIRKTLLDCGRVFLRYAVCSVADHVRILQCYRCLQFGHMAKTRKSKPACGHCAGDHEMKDCPKRQVSPACLNCIQNKNFSGDTAHSAMDSKRYPILGRKIKVKIADTNYG